MATIRKEDFVSLRGPQHGGVVCTRRLGWPGGKLHVNCDTTFADGEPGELKVRVVDARRKPLAGFGYDDNISFHADSVDHEVTWKESNIANLKGHVVRLELFLTSADLFTFRAVAPDKD